MQPNWSKLEAIGRAALVVFLATFFGALVFSGGEVPLTWVAWRPILGTALGAAIAAEIVWVRSQLAAVASSMGLGLARSAPAANDAAKRGFISARVVLGLAVLGLVAGLLFGRSILRSPHPIERDGVTLVGAGEGAGCSPAAGQQVVSDVTKAIPLTNTVCALAPDSPVGQPWVEVLCAIAQGGEQLVATIGTLLEYDGGPLGSMQTTMTIPVVSVRLRIPSSSAPGFLAAHRGAAALGAAPAPAGGRP